MDSALGFGRTGPMWAARAYAPTTGLDHLGLDSVSADWILPALAPGINVLTQHPRYWSFFAFVLDEFWSQPLPRTSTAFKAFYRPWEAVFGLSCRWCDMPEHVSIASGIVGARRLGGVDPEEDFDPRFDYIDSPLGGYGLYYRSVMLDVGLVVGPTGKTSCDAPTPAGRAMATAFRESVIATLLFRDHCSNLGTRPVPPAVIKDFARAGCLCQLRAGTPDLPLLQDAFLHGGDPEAAQRRRDTLRFVLDLALASPNAGIGQERYRQLIYYREIDDDEYTPLPPITQTARRWRLYQAREYFAFALNRLWAWLAVRGLEMTSGGLVTLPMAAVRELVFGDLDNNSFAEACEIAYPGIKAAMPGEAFTEWLAMQVDTSAGMDLGWRRHASLDEHTLCEWCRYPEADPETLVAMLATLLLLYRRIGRADLGDDAEFLRTSSDRIPLATFFNQLHQRLTAGHNIGELLWWIMEDLVIAQHERIATTKLPDDTFRFRRVAGGLRFFPQDAPVGFNDSRFNALRSIVHELGLISSITEPDRVLTPDGRRFHRDGDMPAGLLAKAAEAFEVALVADVAAETVLR